jgi:hypothetical protein
MHNDVHVLLLTNLVRVCLRVFVASDKHRAASAPSMRCACLICLSMPGAASLVSPARITTSVWQLSLNIGRIPRDSPATAGPPLAMFSPGGGRPTYPSWYPSGWADSGAPLEVQLELDFDGAECASLSEALSTEHGALRSSKARTLRTRSGQAQLDALARGVAWGLVDISQVEALLVWCIDLPSGLSRPGGVSLPEGTRLCCSTQVWKAGEAQRFEAQLKELRERHRLEGGEEKARTMPDTELGRRIKELERKLPRAATVEVPGPWAGEVTVSTQGQLAVQRVVQGRFPNPLAKVAEFGVVGTFELVPEARYR